MPMPAMDLTGQKFGYLTVLSREGSSSGKTKKATWRCTCICGGQVVRESQSLRSQHRPNARHCGCRHGEWVTKHGKSRSSTYKSWIAMRRRCMQPKDKDWANYGGRGITICISWIDSFDAFLADMGTRPRGTTLGRIENEKGYAPENCRWETPLEQGVNRRNTRFVATPRGPVPLTKLARSIGMKPVTLRARLDRGVPLERALSMSGLSLSTIFSMPAPEAGL